MSISAAADLPLAAFCRQIPAPKQLQTRPGQDGEISTQSRIPPTPTAPSQRADKEEAAGSQQ